MPKIKYIGTADNFSELAYTGKQSVWQVSQMEDRPDVEAGQLMATGLFDTEAVPIVGKLNPLTGRNGLVIDGREANIQNICDRFFASLPNGEGYRSRKALLAPPDWVASKVYGTGSVAKNGGNAYLCQNSFGAAAASGGPSGTSSMPITDGALKWLYIGPADAALADSDDAPVVTFGATHGTTTRRYNPLVTDDVGAFWLTGAAYVEALAWGGQPCITGVGQSCMFAVDFCTDAPIVSFSTYANNGWSSAANARVYTHLINDRPLYLAGGSQPGVDLTPGHTVFDFSAKPKKVRRIRTYMGATAFTGVGIGPQYSLWAPANPHRYRLVTEGDSTMNGATPTNSSVGSLRSARIAAMLGCDDVWTFAAGNTGFINSGGGSTVISRAPSVIAAAPDILYVAPINNDVGNDATYNTTTRKAAYKAYFDLILDALPSCIIICGGGYTTGAANLLTTAVSAWQVEADMAAAIAEYNHPHVKFLPSISAPGGRWLYGDGHVGTTSNSTHGNSDLMIGDGTDTLHPNQRFLEYVMWREYHGIVNIMNSLN